MSRHVSAEKLARLREDDLRPAAARRVAAHVRGCPACQAESDALAALPGLLASAQFPPMPAHLTARIETALATESAQRAADAAPAARGRAGRAGGRYSPAGGIGPIPVTRSRRRLPGSSRLDSLPGPAMRILATAAVIAVIGGGGYGVFATLGQSSPPASSAASAGTPATRLPAPVPAPVPSALPGANGSGLSGGVVHPGAIGRVTFGPVTSYRSGGHSGQFTPVRTATDYQPGQLGRQAAAALAVPNRPTAGGAVSDRPVPAAPSASSFGGDSLSRLSGCVGRVAGGAAVLLVDVAAYRGQPATIIVTAGSPDQVWVVGPGCSASASDVLARQSLP
jgi:hypothetical protein